MVNNEERGYSAFSGPHHEDGGPPLRSSTFPPPSFRFRTGVGVQGAGGELSLVRVLTRGRLKVSPQGPEGPVWEGQEGQGELCSQQPGVEAPPQVYSTSSQSSPGK